MIDNILEISFLHESIYFDEFSTDKIKRASAARFDDIELLQYTGYKDVNGKEIYEHDILKLPDGEIGVMAINKGNWEALHKSGMKLIDNNYYDCVEVIGNIYENGELLND